MSSETKNYNSVIEELHNVQLQMIKYIDEICSKNNIEYMLAFGSMLGAVRHKGFIPWDDDIDIMMTLKEYLIFRNATQKNTTKYFVQDPQTEKESPFVYPKLRKNGTYMKDDCAYTLKMHEGIWVDIFILIDSCKTKRGIKIQNILIKFFQMMKCKYRYINDKEKYRVTALKKIIYKLPNPLFRFIEKTLFKLICAIGSSKGDNYYLLSNSTLAKSIVPKKWYKNKIRFKFEDTHLLISKYYDDYLKSLYEDYMTPIKYGSHANENNLRFN